MVAFTKSKDDVLNTSLDSQSGTVDWTGSGVFNPPNYTTTTRDALTPSTGDTIYNTTTNKLNVYTGAAWEAVTSA